MMHISKKSLSGGKQAEWWLRLTTPNQCGQNPGTCTSQQRYTRKLILSIMYEHAMHNLIASIFNCELCVFPMFTVNRFTNMHNYYMVWGRLFAIIGFAVWPDLPKTQLLNYVHVIKNCPRYSMAIRICH